MDRAGLVFRMARAVAVGAGLTTIVLAVGPQLPLSLLMPLFLVGVVLGDIAIPLFLLLSLSALAYAVLARHARLSPAARAASAVVPPAYAFALYLAAYHLTTAPRLGRPETTLLPLVLAFAAAGADLGLAVRQPLTALLPALVALPVGVAVRLTGARRANALFGGTTEPFLYLERLLRQEWLAYAAATAVAAIAWWAVRETIDASERGATPTGAGRTRLGMSWLLVLAAGAALMLGEPIRSADAPPTPRRLPRARTPPPPVPTTAPGAPRVAVLRRGQWDKTERLLLQLGQAPATVDTSAMAREPVVVVPPGGLTDVDGEALSRVPASGGVLVVLAPAWGREMESLPGGGITGFGYRQDGSAYQSSVYVDAFHPALASLSTARASSEIDGHFETVPRGAQVLLRRAKDGYPTAILYRSGRGWVFASTAYDGLGAVPRGAVGVLRDLLSWAAAPSDLPIHAPGERVGLRVVWRGPANTARVRLTLRTPSRDRVLAAQTFPRPAAGWRSALLFEHEVPSDAELGIYPVDVEALDDSGNPVDVPLPQAGERLLIARPPALRAAAPELSAALVMPDGETVQPQVPARFRYRIDNRGDRPLRLRLYSHFTQKGTPQLLADIEVPARGRYVAETRGAPPPGPRGFWIDVFDEGAAPTDTGKRRVSEGKGYDFGAVADSP